LVMLRLCSPQLDSGNEALLRRVKVLEDASQGIGSGQLSADCVQSVLISDQPPEPAKKAIIPEPTAAPEPEEPFERWGEVLHNLSETCVPLFAALKNSNAGIRGDMVLIQADSELFRSLVGQDDNKALLASAIRAVTGKNCRIGIKKVTAGQKPADPLSALLQNAREKGVNIVES
ncbi:MAG: hypothetical protein FWE80_07980, partial [Oscillospiraceae bacterium]|nr:hypothetical protein [Oscillospiraceae bacterium]